MKSKSGRLESITRNRNEKPGNSMKNRIGKQGNIVKSRNAKPESIMRRSSEKVKKENTKSTNGIIIDTILTFAFITM